MISLHSGGWCPAASGWSLAFFLKAHAELEAQLGRWRGVAKAADELSIGLDEVEFVDGVLWYGLAHCGRADAPEEQQKRVITNRLVRWTTWDGGDGARTAAASRPVPDQDQE